MAEPRPLAEHLAWLESTGARPCTCRYEWLPARQEMPGWARVSTEPDCPEHGTASHGG